MGTPKSRYPLLNQSFQSWKTEEYADVRGQSAGVSGPPPKQMRAPLSLTLGCSSLRSSWRSWTKPVTRARRHACHLWSPDHGTTCVPVSSMYNDNDSGL